MNSNKIPLREVVATAVGEVIVGALICLVFLLCGKYDYRVLLGAALGVLVTVANFLFLCITVNKALDRCLASFNPTLTEKTAEPIVIEPAEACGEESYNEENADEPYDDEAAKFARENVGKLQNAIKISYIVRMGTVIASLVIALTTKQFNVIATVIPLLCLRPILTVSEMIKRKEKK